MKITTSSPAGSDGEGDFIKKFVKMILDFASHIPLSDEKGNSNPRKRAQAIATKAASKAAAVSGTLAIPPGPLGMATIFPDLLLIWKIQGQMVSDIASCFGKKAALTRETMIYCLFRHSAASLFRDIVVRAGERYIIRRTTLRVLQAILGKLGIRLTQRVIGKTISRWIPVVGALGIAAYGYYDTTQVAANAIELFSKEIDQSEGKSGQ